MLFHGTPEHLWKQWFYWSTFVAMVTRHDVNVPRVHEHDKSAENAHISANEINDY